MVSQTARDTVSPRRNAAAGSTTVLHTIALQDSRYRFCTASDQCSRTHLPFLPARSPRLETDFCSPAETASFRKPPRRGQRSCPISSTQLPTLRPARSALNSHPLPRFSRRRGMFTVQVPLPSSEPEALRLPSDFRSLSGLSSFQIEALNRWLGLRNLPLSPARFPFAPRER